MTKIYTNKYSMILHHIHDLSNLAVITLLKEGLSSVTEDAIIKNYHPDYADLSSNLFFILKNGRYKEGHGKYFVMEEDNKYVCSAGWNEYDYDPSIALLLTRMYVNKAYRAKFHVGNHILPIAIDEAIGYEKVWMTSNNHNTSIHTWFNRVSQGKRPSLFNDWPPIYKRFKSIGKREIYYTEQEVVELIRHENE